VPQLWSFGKSRGPGPEVSEETYPRAGIEWGHPKPVRASPTSARREKDQGMTMNDSKLVVPTPREVESLGGAEETKPKKIGWTIHERRGTTVYKFVGDVDWDAYNREVRLKGREKAPWPPAGLEVAQGRRFLQEGDSVLVQGLFGFAEATVKEELNGDLSAYTEGRTSLFTLDFDEEYDEWVSTGQINLKGLSRLHLNKGKEQDDG